MRSRTIGIAATIGLTLVLIGGPASGQAPTSTSDVDAGAIRYLDPGDQRLGRIEQTLPFDVQFYLRLPADDTVTGYSGRYVGDRKPLVCAEAFPRWPLYVKYADFGAREIARSEKRQEHPITLTRFVTVNPPSAVEGKWAELNVTRGLRPSRYYCFEFTRTRKAEGEPEVFRKALAAAVDQTMRETASKLKDATDKDRQQAYDELRQDVIGAVESQLQPGERLIVPADTFLDREATNRSLPAESRRSFDEVLEAQENRAPQIGELGGAQERFDGTPFPELAEEALTVVMGNPALQVLRQTLDLDPMPELLAPVLRGKDASVRSLAELDTSSRPLVDLGSGAQALPASSEALATPVEAAWLPEHLTTRRTNLQQTVDGLTDVRSLAIVFAGNEELRKLLASEDDDAALAGSLVELGDSIKRALGELEAVAVVMDELSGNLEKRQQKLLELVANIAKEIVETLLVEGTTTADYEVRANWFLGMDFGVAWADGVEDLFGYVGTNIYFRPINKKAPLSWSDFRRGQRRNELMKRLSLTLGIVVNSLERDCQTGVPLGEDAAESVNACFEGLSQENITQGLIADRPLILAGGLRLNDFFRVSIGALAFKEPDPNPLLSRTQLAWTPMISFSIEWNVRGAITNRLAQQPFPAE